MNCGRSSSVEWKLPKLQRRVRFPSPAPPPPGYAPGGFVVRDRHAWPAAHTSAGPTGTKLSPLTPLAGDTGTKLSQLAAQRATPVQNSPSSQPSRVEPVQNSPCSPKMAHFSTFYASRENFIPLSPPTRRAGRTLYRIQGRCRHKTPPARATIETMIGSEPQTTADRIQPSPSVPHPLPALEAPKFLDTATSAPYGASRESPRNREVHQPRLALPPTVSSRMQSHLGQSLCQIH